MDSTSTTTTLNARRLVTLLTQDGNRPGEGLRQMALLHVFGTTHADEFRAALHHAVQCGWLGVSDTEFVFLTKEGYSIVV